MDLIDVVLGWVLDDYSQVTPQQQPSVEAIMLQMRGLLSVRGIVAHWRDRANADFATDLLTNLTSDLNSAIKDSAMNTVHGQTLAIANRQLVLFECILAVRTVVLTRTLTLTLTLTLSFILILALTLTRPLTLTLTVILILTLI